MYNWLIIFKSYESTRWSQYLRFHEKHIRVWKQRITEHKTYFCQWTQWFLKNIRHECQKPHWQTIEHQERTECVDELK